ncbi:MATE family efflux transporter [Frisingicoccus sp.]|uniref:MATE family efflux transporter n=1 Tax=Frisingicoccus sp. TaxID=1918627 RepID=UPI003AB8AE78
MNIQLSEHFNYKKLLRFTLPSIVMMIFTSIYSVVDGFFVSNFVGKTPFAAVNFIMPFLMILGAFGFMFGTGGSALISKTMGEGDNEKAKRIFSLLVYVSIGCGVVVAVLGIIFIRPVAALLGAQGVMLENCVLYGRIILAALPAFMLQYEFQSFFVTAEKPHLGLVVTVAAGVTNMVLDALLVAVFSLGLVGAAAATALSQCVGGLVPLVYFGCKNSSALRLTRTKFDGKVLFKTCTNGASELMSNISASIVGMLYNIQLIKYAGENGVTAYGVLMYVNFIFLAVFIGYSVGTAPIIGYNYGAGNHSELKNLLKRSLWIIGICSVAMVFAAEILARPLATMYVGYDIELFELTLRGFKIYSLAFLFAGMAIFGSSFFTALNNGLISALLSFLRTIVFEVSGVFLIPIIFGIDGIWMAIVVANGLAAVVTILFLLANRKRYHY